MLKKTAVLFEVVLGTLLFPSEHGLSESDLATHEAYEEFQTLSLAAALRLEPARVGALTSGLKRYLAYCELKDVDVRNPAAVHLARFLKLVAEGGPTAAASMYHVLKWYVDNMGCTFPMDNFMIRPYRLQQPSHTAIQSKELEPWEFFNMLVMWLSSSGTLRFLHSLQLALAGSCVRWEHVQRSSCLFLDEHQPAMFRCSQGKRREQGARPAYDWATPAMFNPFGLDFLTPADHADISSLTASMQKKARTSPLSEEMSDGLREEATVKCPVLLSLQRFYLEEMVSTTFLVPALMLNSADLYAVTNATALRVDKPMSRGKFLELLRGNMVSVGVPVGDTPAVKYNRLRRFCPTMANLFGLSREDCQAVGNWQDIPQGGGPQRFSKAAQDMSVRYSGSKALRSLQVKRFCIRRLFWLWAKEGGRVARVPGPACSSPSCAGCPRCFVKPGAWCWEHVSTAHLKHPMDVGKLLKDPNNVTWEAPRGSVGSAKPSKVVDPLLPVDSNAPPSSPTDMPSPSERPSPTSPVDDAASSESASDQSADHSDLEDVFVDMEDINEVAWFQQGKKVHLVCGDDPSEDFPTPVCKDSPYAAPPRARGLGLTGVQESSLCERCVARSSRQLYAMLATNFGWMY